MASVHTRLSGTISWFSGKGDYQITVSQGFLFRLPAHKKNTQSLRGTFFLALDRGHNDGCQRDKDHCESGRRGRPILWDGNVVKVGTALEAGSSSGAHTILALLRHSLSGRRQDQRLVSLGTVELAACGLGVVRVLSADLHLHVGRGRAGHGRHVPTISSVDRDSLARSKVSHRVALKVIWGDAENVRQIVENLSQDALLQFRIAIEHIKGHAKRKSKARWGAGFDFRALATQFIVEILENLARCAEL